MDSPERGALMLVRILAAGLMGWALAELALYWALCQHKNVSMEMIPCAVKSLPLVAGTAMLVKSRALAEWISNLLDD
jgi:hypothetical protein